MTKPTILTHEQMRPGQEVEQHLRKHGHLPETGCCDPTPVTNIDGGKIMFNTIEEALTPPTK